MSRVIIMSLSCLEYDSSVFPAAGGGVWRSTEGWWGHATCSSWFSQRVPLRDLWPRAAQTDRRRGDSSSECLQRSPAGGQQQHRALVWSHVSSQNPLRRQPGRVCAVHHTQWVSPETFTEILLEKLYSHVADAMRRTIEAIRATAYKCCDKF